MSEQQGGVFKPKLMGSTVRSMKLFETSDSSPGNSLVPVNGSNNRERVELKEVTQLKVNLLFLLIFEAHAYKIIQKYNKTSTNATQKENKQNNSTMT